MDPIVPRVRSALSMLTAGARVLRQTGLLEAFSPVAGVRYLRDRVRRKASGGVMILHLHALHDPLRPAIVDVKGGERLSYGELDQLINRLAHGLHSLGVGHRDRVGLLLRNGHEHIVTSGALSYLGAVS